MLRLGLVLSTLLLIGCSVAAPRVLLVHYGWLREDTVGDLHVFLTVKALRELGYEVTLCHRAVLETPPDNSPFKLLTGEDQLFAAVVEFLWMGVGYFEQIIALNRMLRDLSPRTVIITVQRLLPNVHLRTATKLPPRQPGPSQD